MKPPRFPTDLPEDWPEIEEPGRMPRGWWILPLAAAGLGAIMAVVLVQVL